MFDLVWLVLFLAGGVSEGMAIGTAAFVEEFFQLERAAFSASRKTGARRMRGGDWEGLRVARAPVVEPVSLPPPSKGERQK